MERHFTAAPNMHNVDTEFRHHYYSKNDGCWKNTELLYQAEKAEISDIKHQVIQIGASLKRSEWRKHKGIV